MKKYLTILSLLFICSYSQGQYYWDFGLKLGASNYLGDIGGLDEDSRSFVYDMKLSQTRWATGAFARYKASELAAVTANFYYGRIQGADSLSERVTRVGRNLSFRNDILELNVRGDFFVYSMNDVGRRGRYQTNMDIYLFAGIGAIYSNPKANYMGTWHALQPLNTEGPNNSYNKFGAVIPAGVGLYFTYKRQYRIGWELGYRTTFTDYLDDISGTYTDPSNLSSPLAVELANRRDELSDPSLPGPQNYGQEGTLRGDPTDNDGYVFSTFNFSYVMRTKRYWKRRKHSWLFKNRSRGRRSRSKF